MSKKDDTCHLECSQKHRAEHRCHHQNGEIRLLALITQDWWYPQHTTHVLHVAARLVLEQLPTGHHRVEVELLLGAQHHALLDGALAHLE